MHRYELTDRGKIIIAVLVVLLLLALSAVLMVKAFANQSTAPPVNQDPAASGSPNQSNVGTSPEIIDSPPPTGGVFSPPDISSSHPDGNGDDAPFVSPPDGSEDASPAVSPPNGNGDNAPAVSPPNGNGDNAPAVSPPNGSEDASPAVSPPDGNGDASPTVSPPPDGNGNSSPGAASPSPDNSGVVQPPISSPSNSGNPGGNPGESGNPGDSGNPGGQDNIRPSSPGPLGGNPSEGTLSFSFSPDLQNELDSETIMAIGELLKSRRNTQNSMIAVETQMLSVGDDEKLMAAIIASFNGYGISKDRISRVVRQSGSAMDTFEVQMYFVNAFEK